MNVIAGSLTVNVVGGALLFLGFVVIWATVVFWRGSTEDDEVLAPLEVMGDRRFRRLDDDDKLDVLNAMRPEGAEPVRLFARTEVITTDESGSRVVDRTEDFGHRYRRFADSEQYEPSPVGGVRRPGRRGARGRVQPDWDDDPSDALDRTGETDRQRLDRDEPRRPRRRSRRPDGPGEDPNIDPLLQ